MIRGAIICESLLSGTALDQPELHVMRLSRYDVTGAADYQPSTWTLLEFEAPETADGPLAEALAAALAAPGWYANWNSDSHATVVFPGLVFRYVHGDAAGREAAQTHGRLAGVPEPQLDWAD